MAKILSIYLYLPLYLHLVFYLSLSNRGVVRNLFRGVLNFYISSGRHSTRWDLKAPEIQRFHLSRGGLSPHIYLYIYTYLSISSYLFIFAYLSIFNYLSISTDLYVFTYLSISNYLSFFLYIYLSFCY